MIQYGMESELLGQTKTEMAVQVTCFLRNVRRGNI